MVELNEEQIMRLKNCDFDMFDELFGKEIAKMLFPNELTKTKFRIKWLNKIDLELKIERDRCKRRITQIIKNRRLIRDEIVSSRRTKVKVK